MSNNPSESKCPLCGSVNLALDRRHDGLIECVDCTWTCILAEFFKKDSSEPKHREFWVTKFKDGDLFVYGYREAAYNLYNTDIQKMIQETIHVIEKSALTALQKENDILKQDLQAENDRLERNEKLEKENEQLKQLFSVQLDMHDQIEQLEARLKEADEALDFYASVNNWDSYLGVKNLLDDDDIEWVEHFVEGVDCSDDIGGKRARQYQAKWGKE